MDILITGGTGFIGSALVNTLTGPAELGGGHRVTVFTRKPQRLLEARAELHRAGLLQAVSHWDELGRDARFDVVINLAGEGIADRPWSAQRKRELHASRVTLTESLLDWMRLLKRRPAVLISGSAVGWYGSQGERLLEEDASPHDEYVHQLCDEWEKAARGAEALNMRVCILRTGIVIGPGGGFLRRLLPLFGLGLGGPVGSGEQYLSWVSLTDVVQVILRLIADSDLKGVFNVTGPRPVTNAEFTRSLASLLRRPAILRVPASVLKLAMGEMSTLLLDGQRVLPSRLLQARYRFQHADLEAALRAALSRRRVNEPS